MPVTTLHLSSENSRDLGNGKHELDLIPGLEFPHQSNPQCYLHTLSFSNTITNVSASLYDNARISLGTGATDKGVVKLNIPTDDNTRLYVGIVANENATYVAPLHKDAAFVGGSTGAYTHASMKDTLADLDGLKVDGSGGLLDLINTVVDNTFLSAPWVQGVSQLDSDPHAYPIANLGKGFLNVTCDTKIDGDGVYFNNMAWAPWTAATATASQKHAVKGETEYKIRDQPSVANAAKCAGDHLRFLSTAEIKKAITSARDAGGVPGASATINTDNIVSVTELLGIQVGINGNGNSSTARPGSGAFTGEFDGTTITSSEGVAGSFSFPYDDSTGFKRRPAYPTDPADSKAQKAANKSTGAAYQDAMMPGWKKFQVDGRGSYIEMTANDHKHTTNPMGPSLFPCDTVQRGKVAISDDPTVFGWTTNATSATVTLQGSFDIQTLEREIALRFKLDDPGPTGLFAQFHDIADPENDEEYDAAATMDELLDGNKAKKQQKLITLEPDDTTNRVRAYLHNDVILLSGSTLMTGFLGFGANQTGELAGTFANGPARVDRARAVAFHCPSVVSGVYSSAGRLGGSQLALVPIEAQIGRPQVYTTSVPIKLKARTAGTKLQKVIFYLSSEDGQPIDMQKERFDATVVVEWE